MTKVWSQNDLFKRHGYQTSHKIEPCDSTCMKLSCTDDNATTYIINTCRPNHKA